ncbi:hypothetical protein ABB37_04701 [Leptomonas pyrrhocoris]|uniref:Uncharacterized protein n=1 Tax=Leptomonas pyrrhocoris TaxID=157538 RepID=A0A0N0DVR3_LEPPY|nr:hypothetical protein ABB37_04701 [Leptomonas pyrrhocoris]KPA80481.1 hypothetical protein ABB37_04701 [Leptomonas pyrrhocoris]|eukprot:XP_015658920.1 hypothetical protein ABB37_04701 [Leptomonas pyrrhocoris]
MREVKLPSSPAPSRRALFGAVPIVLLATLCLIVAPTKLGQARLTPASPTSAARDSRVAALRDALRAEHRVETIPDPPPELGIHTACKKFGRGCPDAYVAFLEDVVASLRPVLDTEEHNASSGSTGSTAEQVKETENEAEASSASSSRESAAPPSTSPSRLSLPVQTSWSYAEFKRLESILVRIKVAETQLDRHGIASRELQRKHCVPRGEDLTFQDDFNGEVTAQLSLACASLHRGQSATSAAWKMTEDEAAMYATWCRYMEHRRKTNEEDVQAGTSLPFVFHLARLPYTPFGCYVMDGRRWYARLLLWLDSRLAFFVSWTWSVALPGSCCTFVLLWIYIGEGWGAGAEAIVFGVGEATNAQEEDQREARDAPDSQELVAASQFRQSRLAGLRYAFIECVQHRSWPMSFLKLRLVLCLIVAVDLLWSLGQILYITLWSLSSPKAASGHQLLPASIGFVLRLLPAWVQVVTNVYVVVVLQGVVLRMALSGAASAYADWQDFIAKCATEQEYLLKAAADVSL